MSKQNKLFIRYKLFSGLNHSYLELHYKIWLIKASNKIWL